MKSKEEELLILQALIRASATGFPPLEKGDKRGI
jgi:hypothetical protein